MGLPIVAQANDDAFSVKNYEVTLARGNTNTLRERAIKQATREAFPKLLRQLTPRHTWSAHSNLLEYVNWDDVSYKTNILEEKYNPVYKAVFDIYYREKAVKDLLTKFNIPYTESTGGRVLIVPVFEEGNFKQLWETTNPLKDALNDAVRSHGSFEYIMPEGDTDETAALNADMATLGAGDLILNLANKYEATAAVVYHAKVSKRFGSYYLDVTANWYEPDVQAEPSLFTAPIEDIAFVGGEIDYGSLNGVFKLAADDILSHLGAHKRSQGLVEVNKPGRVFLRFKPADARDLEKLKEVVGELNTISEFKLRVLNVKDSVFQVDFFGDRDAFKEQLQKTNLTVEETKMPMVWKVQFKNDPFLGPVNYEFDDE